MGRRLSPTGTWEIAPAGDGLSGDFTSLRKLRRRSAGPDSSTSCAPAHPAKPTDEFLPYAAPGSCRPPDHAARTPIPAYSCAAPARHVGIIRVLPGIRAACRRDDSDRPSPRRAVRTPNACGAQGVWRTLWVRGFAVPPGQMHGHPIQSGIEDVVVPQMWMRRAPGRCERGGDQEGNTLFGSAAM